MRNTRSKTATEKQTTKQNKWIREGSTVMVIAGNDKGRTGKVIWRDDTRAKIEGVNIRKKHVRRRDANTPGQILEVEGKVHVSNLRLCNDKGEPVKTQVRVNDEGKKELVGIKGGEEEVLRKISRA